MGTGSCVWSASAGRSEDRKQDGVSLCSSWPISGQGVSEQDIDPFALPTLLYNAPEGLSLFELMQWLGHKDPGSTQHYARVKATRLAAAYSKAERNSRLVEALVDTKADVTGKVNIYYVLGEHGLCGNPDWASCLYRMACIKCPFFVPKDQARLIEASRTVKRFMEVVELTEEELAAVQDDYHKLEAAVERTQHVIPPTMLRRRAKGAVSRGIPLTVFNTSSD